MNEYETVCILQPDLPGAGFEKIKDKVVKVLGDNQAHILNQKDWGKRKLAYRVGKCTSGHYLYFNYTGSGHFITDLERMLKYEEGVIRYLTVKVDEDVKTGVASKTKRVLVPEELKFGFDEGKRDFDGPRRGSRFEDQGGYYAEEN